MLLKPMQYYPWYMISLLLIPLGFLNCKSVPFQPEQYKGDYLIIGDGGGYSGWENRYYITTRGAVYLHSGRDTTYLKQSNIDKRIVNQALENVRALDLVNYEYSNPGNVYKFLAMSIDGIHNRIVWGGNQDQINPAITNLYQLLNSSLQKKDNQ